MVDDNHESDDIEVQVVEPAATKGRLAHWRVGGIMVAILLLVAGWIVLSSNSDDRRDVAIVAADTVTVPTDSSVPDSAATTTSSTSTTTTSTTTTTTTTTNASSESGGSGASSGSSGSSDSCSWVMPSLLGRTIAQAAVLFIHCLNQSARGLGPQVGFEVHTTSEPCTDDPALYDRIESQSPGAGTPFGGGTVRINVSIYRNCSAPSTTMYPLPPMIPPYPPIPDPSIPDPTPPTAPAPPTP